MLKLIFEKFIKFFPIEIDFFIRYLAYRRNNTNYILQWVRKNRHSFDVIVDVGSNRGFFSYQLSPYATHVFCFEPNNKLFKWSQMILPKNCKVFPEGLGLSAGIVNLIVPLDKFNRELDGLSTISSKNQFLGSNHVFSTRKVPVLIKPLDSLKIPLHLKSVLLKIDVEGFEMDVLNGAKKFIDMHKPVIYIECERRHGAYLDDVFGFLNLRGYESFSIDSFGCIKAISVDQVTSAQDISLVGSSRYIADILFIQGGESAKD